MNLATRTIAQSTVDTRGKWDVVLGCCRKIDDSVIQAVRARKGNDNLFLAFFMGYSNIAIRVAEVISSASVPLLQQLQFRKLSTEGVTLKGIAYAFGCLKTVRDINNLSKIIKVVKESLWDSVVLVRLGG